MPYSKTTWVDNLAPAIDAANLNNLEDGISKGPYGPDASSNNVPVWGGSSWAYQLITNAQISASAAIAASKLASYPSDATKFLNGAGGWTVPTGIKSGVATVVWPGSATLSSGTTVTHGVGSTPSSVVATMHDIVSGVSVICPIQVTTVGSTTFALFAQTTDASTPAAASSITVYWMAVP